jgi:hypothetical protein
MERKITGPPPVDFKYVDAQPLRMYVSPEIERL